MNYNRKVDGTDIIISDNTRNILRINESADETSMIYRVSGEMINEIAYELEDELIAGMSVRNVLILDLAELTYIASAGFRSLLKVQHIIDERDRGELILRNLNPAVKDMFIQNGFLELFDVR